MDRLKEPLFNIAEEVSMNQVLQVFGIVLVKEIKNPNNQGLSRRDTQMAFNTLFRLLQKSNKSAKLV